MIKLNRFVFLSAIIAVVFFGFLNFSTLVYAVVPTLSVTGTGSGDYVQINVAGDTNSSVTLFYLNSSSNTQSASIGTTDATGNFSTVISSEYIRHSFKQFGVCCYWGSKWNAIAIDCLAIFSKCFN